MTNKQIGIAIVVLIIAALAVNASGLNLKRFLPAQQSGTSTITAQDEQRPVMRRQDTASDGGGVQFGGGMQGSQTEYAAGTVGVRAPAVGRITANGPGTKYVDQYMKEKCRPGTPESKKYPCVTSDQYGNACQIGSCRDAEIQGLPPVFYGGRQ